MSQGLRPVIDFLLYDWLRVTTLCSRPRYAEHGRETFDAVLDTCERIAREKYASHNRTDAAGIGRLQACRYFFHYELPKIGPWLQVVRTRDATCAAMPEEAF